MSQKVNCPWHDDNTASCHIYEDSFFCFGCGATGTLDKLAGKAPTFKNAFKLKGKPENLEESLSRIAALPTKEIRGLNLPYDTRGYYIVYPNAEYYVLRRWEAQDANKYVGPLGHRKPMYGRNSVDCPHLILVEGQINAASIRASGIKLFGSYQCAVSSPGAATDFLKPMVLEYCLQYQKICIIVDKDAAGVAAGLQLRDKLVKAGKAVVLYPVERDFNQVLCENGASAVKEEISKALALFSVQTGHDVSGSEQGAG